MNMAYHVTRNTGSNYVLMEGHKKGSLMIRSRIILEIFIPYREINNLEIEFWVENTLVASYSRVVIASVMCSKVTLGHHFDNNF